jgi:hypothetical protein
LLFGCEVIRNPAALIHHSMAFDLIRVNELQWQEMQETVPMIEGCATDNTAVTKIWNCIINTFEDWGLPFAHPSTQDYIW